MTILRYPIEGAYDPWGQYDDDDREIDPYRHWDDPEWDAEAQRERTRSDFLRACLKRRPAHHEGARRKKLFTVARKTMLAIARLRGAKVTPLSIYPWSNRRGIAAGLILNLNSEERIEWSPRTGYRYIRDEIPF